YLLMTAKENLRKKKIDEEQLLHVVQKKSGEILSNMNSTNFLVKNYVNNYFEGVYFLNILNKLQNVQLSDVLAIDNVMFHKIINQSYYKNQNELDCHITLYYF